MTSTRVGNYIAGFVDADGSFNISIQDRPDFKLKWKTIPVFNVAQKERYILEQIKKHLKCGKIRQRADGLFIYEVNKHECLKTKVIPFFKEFKFISQKKKSDFLIFTKVVDLVSQRLHLTKNGIITIVNLRKSFSDRDFKRKFDDDYIISTLE